MNRCFPSPLADALYVPSPLAGEGQGEGYRATCSLDLSTSIPSTLHAYKPPVQLPLSPALPRKGGGSPLPMPLHRHDFQLERGA
jgi:hypothetical protein